jgi:hypothetical protein
MNLLSWPFVMLLRWYDRRSTLAYLADNMRRVTSVESFQRNHDRYRQIKAMKLRDYRVNES